MVVVSQLFIVHLLQCLLLKIYHIIGKRLENVATYLAIGTIFKGLLDFFLFKKPIISEHSRIILESLLLYLVCIQLH